MTESLHAALEALNLELSDVGAWLLSSGLQLLFIWVLAWVATRLVHLVARRIVAVAEDDDPTSLSYHEKRAQTVAQLLRSVGRAAILTFAVLLSLSLFINVAPLIAGAGILGLAVSFGAQSLVKDFIAGFFILMENQFVVGDTIEVAGRNGTVERMTLRVVMLRDVEGVLHIIPNGQMTTVSNRTRGWSQAVVDVTVDYESSLEAAIAALCDEADRMATDPAWVKRLAGTPEVVGVHALGENALTLRTQLRTLPGRQTTVAREFRRRIKLRFDREGIHIRPAAPRLAAELPPATPPTAPRDPA